MQRSNNGDPRAMLALATNDEEAKVAIETWLGSPLIQVNAGVKTGNKSMSIKHVNVREFCDESIRVYGYIQGLKQRSELLPSFELSLDRESAKALAESILAQL